MALCDHVRPAINQGNALRNHRPSPGTKALTAATITAGKGVIMLITRQQASRKMNPKVIWGGGVLLVALVLLVGFLWHSWARRQALREAEAVTRKYLEAMAAGDIPQAFSYMALSDEKRQAMLKRESEKPLAQRGPSIKLISVGSARLASDNSGNILVKETVIMMNRKITDEATVVYDKDSQRWLVQLDE
jgi:hypothetical protein